MSRPPTQISDVVDGREPDERLLIDRFLPSCDFTVVHVGVLGAPPATCYATARHLNLLDSPIIRVLLGIRALPQRVAERWAERDGVPGTRTPSTTFGLDDMVRYGWTLLGEAPNEEVVFGQIGRPWKPVGASAGPAITADAFPGFGQPGFAKIAFSLRVNPHRPRSSIVTLETRVALTDSEGRRKFGRYWRIVAPFVALIDRMALRLIAAELDRAATVGHRAAEAKIRAHTGWWGATDKERKMPLPGDDLVPHPQVQITHALTIAASPEQVWPWLVQLGHGRAGFYSDSPFWDRCVDGYYRLLSRQLPGTATVGYQVQASDRVVPEWQNPRVGDTVSDGPPGTAYYVVRHVEPYREFVLFTDTHLRYLLPARIRQDPRLHVVGEISAGHLLSEPQPGTTRLVRRMRLRCGPWPFRAFAVPVVLIWGEVVTARHFLRGVRRRAEGFLVAVHDAGPEAGLSFSSKNASTRSTPSC